MQKPPPPSTARSSAPHPLSLEALLYKVPLDSAPEGMKALELKDLCISGLPPQLRLFRGLRKFDVSSNALRDLQAVSALSSLTNLNLSHNLVEDLTPLRQLTNLVVLTVSHNKISELTGIEGSAATLKALIANDNRVCLDNEGGEESAGMRNRGVISKLLAIETIVLSRNPLMIGKATDSSAVAGEASTDADLPSPSDSDHPLTCFAALPILRKLSLSECGLTSLPQRWFLPLVREIRLASNHISSVSETVILRSAQTVDLSNNRLTNVVELRRCKFVQQLCLKGNPLCSQSDTRKRSSSPAPHGRSGDVWWQQDVRAHMCLSRMFQNLQSVDGVPFEPLSKEEYLRRRDADGSPKDDGDDDIHEDQGDLQQRSDQPPADGASLPQRRKRNRPEVDVVGTTAANGDDVAGAEMGASVASHRAKRRNDSAIPAEVPDEVIPTPAPVAAASHLIRRERTVPIASQQHPHQAARGARQPGGVSAYGRAALEEHRKLRQMGQGSSGNGWE